MAVQEQGHNKKTQLRQIKKDLVQTRFVQKQDQIEQKMHDKHEAVLSIIKAEPLPAEVAAKSDAMLLNATQEELVALSINPNAPVDIRRRARLLVGQDDELAIKVSETMRNRAFGKPAQSVVIGTGQTPPPPVYNIIYENKEQKDE